MKFVACCFSICMLFFLNGCSEAEVSSQPESTMASAEIDLEEKTSLEIISHEEEITADSPITKTEEKVVKKPKRAKKKPRNSTKEKPIHTSPSSASNVNDASNIHYVPKLIPQSQFPVLFNQNPSYICDGFDFPVGKPNAKGYYKAQNFGDKFHLGEDWNGVGGGNSDLGDPVYAAADGLVTFAQDVCCGWGNTIRVIHYLPHNPDYPYLETLYSHLDRISIRPGNFVKRGQKIGTIGDGHGEYKAHLHFELRDFINMSIGPGYSTDKFGYLDPTPFIKANRPIR